MRGGYLVKFHKIKKKQKKYKKFVKGDVSPVPDTSGYVNFNRPDK